MISPSFITELLERVDCYEVVNRRVPLKPKGDNGWACCPFHDEKTSSFSVSRSKQFYHCFGCGKHGNAISFIMEYEGADYPTAITKLAEEYGLEVKYEGEKKPRPQTKNLTDIMELACGYYRSEFKGKNGEGARKYIHNRGLTDETLEKFGIGFAPDAWHSLKDALKNCSEKDLKTVGLLRDGRTGQSYDFFRNRLMFPIRNARGKIVAFSARTMTGEEPKYINTGETPIFTKGKEIFGLYEGRRAIQEKKRAIVVEGQMDVIQLSQAGFGEACAPLGTAIKTEHIEGLLKCTDQIIFSFDGDGAGRKAAKRAMTLSLPLLKEHQKISFLFLPEGEDPDSYVKKYGKDAFEKLISGSKPLSKFFIDSLKESKNLDVTEDRGALVAEAKPLLASLNNQFLKADLISQLAVLLRTEKALLNKEFGVQEVEAPAPEPAKIYGTGRFGAYYPGKNFFPKYPAPYSKFGNQQRNPNPIYPVGPIRGGASLDKESLLSSILRNFLLYPQLGFAFRNQAVELLINSDAKAAKAILKVLEVLEHEDEAEDFAFKDLFADIPSDPTSPKFEEVMEPIRLRLQNILTTTKLAPFFEEQARSAYQMKPAYELAKLETSQVFLNFEIQTQQEELERLANDLVHNPENKELYRKLEQRRNSALKEKKQIQDEINQIIANSV